MTKQEEIQAYMRGWLKYAQGTYDDVGIDYALKQMIEGLHSQGLVIKVGEFPALMDIVIYPKEVIGGEHPYKKRTQWMEGWNAALIKVGKEVAESGLDFATVAPLIKGREIT